MKASLILGLAILIAATLAAALPTARENFFIADATPPRGIRTTTIRPGACRGPGRAADVHWQSNYAWAWVDARTRVCDVYQAEVPGPESAYNQARLSAHTAATHRHAAVRRELRPRAPWR